MLNPIYWLLVLTFGHPQLTQTMPSPEPTAVMQALKSETVKGKIIREFFVDKGGNVHEDIFDLYVKTGGDKLFIKTDEGPLTHDQLLPYVDKKAQIIIERKDGMWDSDDPNVQSRVGPYCVVLGVKPN